jgi:S1-C subfamily serine protease
MSLRYPCLVAALFQFVGLLSANAHPSEEVVLCGPHTGYIHVLDRGADRVLARVACRETVTVTARNDLWVRVKTKDGIEGEVSSAYLPADGRLCRPQDCYSRGEKLLLSNRPGGAFLEFRRAHHLDLGNKRYERRMRDVGTPLSKDAESIARQAAQAGDLPQATAGLERAVEYDPTNSDATRLLSELRALGPQLNLRLDKARQQLRAGDVNNAQKEIQELRRYRTAIPLLGEVDRELGVVRRLEEAASVWEANGSEQSALQVSALQKEAPANDYAQTLARKVRKNASDRILRTAAGSKGSTLSAIGEAVRSADVALELDPESEAARQARAAYVHSLWEAYRAPGSFVGSSGRWAGRLRLETLGALEPRLSGQPGYETERARALKEAFPAVAVRVAVGTDTQTCTSRPGMPNVSQAVLDAASQAPTPISTIDERQPDLTFTFKRLSCSVTDIPRQSIQPVNSTYVAGYNQLANPAYVQLQTALAAAQAELARATIDNQYNPTVGTAFAVGFARGRVSRLQRDLANTPPYTQQEIVQQYQYEKFEAYRAYRIDSQLQAHARNGFATETEVSFAAENRDEGTSGVLPQDKSGARSRSPVLPAMEELASSVLSGFKKNLANAVRETLAGHFATVSMDGKREDGERLSALLYVFDLADGTRYQKDKENLQPAAKTALLSAPETIRPFLASVSLSLPEQLRAPGPSAAEETRSQAGINRAIEGSVAIETDAGNVGSGFFLTNACLVVTNEHVVTGAETIIVRASSRGLFTAEIVAKDSTRDLALLKSSAKSCAPLDLDMAETITAGQEVWAIGNPLGLSGTVTKGIVSALRTLGGIHFLQVDASVNPGNSGGPLVNRDGRVLGVTTFKVRGYEGLNFAVASGEIRNAFGRFLR